MRDQPNPEQQLAIPDISNIPAPNQSSVRQISIIEDVLLGPIQPAQVTSFILEFQ